MLCVKSSALDRPEASRWIAHVDGPSGQRGRDDRACTHHRAFAQGAAVEHDGPGTDPTIGTDCEPPLGGRKGRDKTVAVGLSGIGMGQENGPDRDGCAITEAERTREIQRDIVTDEHVITDDQMMKPLVVIHQQASMDANASTHASAEKPQHARTESGHYGHRDKPPRNGETGQTERVDHLENLWSMWSPKPAVAAMVSSARR